MNNEDEIYYNTLFERAEYAEVEVEAKFKNIVRDLNKAFGKKIVHHYHLRIKSLKSAAGKMIREEYDSLDQISDFLGGRIICLKPENIYDVSQAIDREFAVYKTKDYISDPKPPSKGGYTGAIHKKINFQVTCGGIRVSVPLEIQITDVLMSAVWETEHDTNYKSLVENPHAEEDNQIILNSAKVIHEIIKCRTDYQDNPSIQEDLHEALECAETIVDLLKSRQQEIQNAAE